MQGNDIIVREIKNQNKDVEIEKFPEIYGKEEITPTEGGTLIHLALQKIQDDNIDETINGLKISKAQKDYLIKNKEIMQNYLESKLFGELKNAKEIHKEETFYMNVKNENGEDILLQGIIDLYFISKNDELVLVDYKTDKNVDEKILKDRYKNQLILYKNALERSLKRKVDKTIIYSTYLKREINLTGGKHWD